MSLILYRYSYTFFSDKQIAGSAAMCNNNEQENLVNIQSQFMNKRELKDHIVNYVE